MTRVPTLIDKSYMRILANRQIYTMSFVCALDTDGADSSQDSKLAVCIFVSLSKPEPQHITTGKLVAFPTAFPNLNGLIIVGGPLGEREAAGLAGEDDEAAEGAE